MKTCSLAIVLVKVLGLSLTVHGLVTFANAICNILWFIMSRGMPNHAPEYFGQMVANYGMNGFIESAMGILLIAKAIFFVERILRIAVEV